MRAAKKLTVDRKLLQELVPLNALSSERFREVSEKIVIEEVLSGNYLFRKGDRDNQSIFLLEGKVNLIDGFRKVTSEVEAGTDMCRYPIANQQPRALSARAVKKVVVAKVDTSLLDVYLTWDQSASAEAVDIDAATNNHWMTRILQSDALLNMPPSMLQSMFIKMETLPVLAGDVVIRQGDCGDYFYMIHEGRCAVTQKATADGEERLLTELGDGDSFGEEVLVSDAMCDATVTMLTDGLLMRLAKEDFHELSKKQLVKRVSYEQASAMVDDGAVWVDVRTPDEYKNGAFEDSVNIPLSRLQDELSELVFNSKYIICCDTGRRSESAGILLSHRGFEVCVLEGGIPGLTRDAINPALQEDSADSVDGLAEVIEFDGKIREVARQSDSDDTGVTTTESGPESAAHVVADDLPDGFESALHELRAENQALREQLLFCRTSEERTNEQPEQSCSELGVSGERPGTSCARVTEVAEEKQRPEWDSERDELKQALENERQAVAGLREQLDRAESQFPEDRSALEAELKVQLDGANEKIVQLEIKQDELQQEKASQGDELRAVIAERTRLQQQLDTLHSSLEQQEERARTLEEEHTEAVRKAHEDLMRKNDNEKELQGQIDRLRKKLEQQTTDQQKDREEARDDLEQLREQLHTERQARAEERAEMAARQRELKDQLAAISTEHEARLSDQNGAIEQARDAARQEEQERLRELLAIHGETEEQVARLQHELKKAHEEIAEIARHEKDRRQVDIDLMEEQNQQAVATISQLESQLKQFTEERDAALEEQQALRDKMSALRAEVEVARGLMSGREQDEDPAQLRRELNESKKNVEIAIRLRAEAEAIRDRALQERDALQQQLNSGEPTCEPLHIPSLDVGEPGVEHTGSAREYQQVNLPVNPQPHDRDGSPDSLVDGKRDQRERRWLGLAIGLGVVVVCALTGWLFFAFNEPVSGAAGQQQSPVAAVPDADPPPVVPTDAPVVEVQPAPLAEEDNTVAESAARIASQPDIRPAMETVSGPDEAHAIPAPEESAAEEAAFAAQAAPVVAGRTFRDSLRGGGRGPVMIELPAGHYEMGSIGNSLNFDEGPRHSVTVPAFSISKFEVTFAEYDRFARATGRRLPHDESWGRGDRPVINVSWGDANGYTRWLSEQTGKTYRLPSEAEWEYAARAGNAANYWWHDDSENPHANCFNCGSEWDGARTSPAGSFEANDFGLKDVTGNVQEWTADCYHGSYQGAPDDGSAWLFPECTMRVVRGGGYTSPLNSLRSAKRSQYDQDTRLDNLGFRVVREN